MSEELKPCPFCGGGTFDITEVPLNRMPRMDGKPSPIVSASVRHWCLRQDGQPSGLNASMHGRDRESAIAAWNRRASPTPEREGGGAIETAKRIVDWDDNGRLADDEWLVERNETSIIAICRALLSTPVDARREALEEAAKVADEAQASAREEVEADKKEMGEDYDPYSFGAGFLSGEITASINIATAIRALSPPVKDTP